MTLERSPSSEGTYNGFSRGADGRSRPSPKSTMARSTQPSATYLLEPRSRTRSPPPRRRLAISGAAAVALGVAVTSGLLAVVQLSPNLPSLGSLSASVRALPGSLGSIPSLGSLSASARSLPFLRQERHGATASPPADVAAPGPAPIAAGATASVAAPEAAPVSAPRALAPAASPPPNMAAPAPPDLAASTPAPAVAEAPVAKPAAPSHRAARRSAPERLDASRRMSAEAEQRATDATAGANLMEAYAPRSTLSAQAAEAPPLE